MNDPRSFFTSESVTEGHPDKLCDQISDGVLDALLAQDPLARVACETATTTGLILVAGEITTTAWADIPDIVRRTIERSRLCRCPLWLRLPHLRRHHLHWQAKPRHRSGRQRSIEYRERTAARHPAPMPSWSHRRGRPGHDDRLRLQRDARTDAHAHQSGPQATRAAFQCPPPVRGTAMARWPICAPTARAR